jgi:hypothetical protein
VTIQTSLSELKVTNPKYKQTYNVKVVDLAKFSRHRMRMFPWESGVDLYQIRLRKLPMP